MHLHAIIIGDQAKAPLTYQHSVRAIAGRGLEGDRYYHHQGSFNRPQLSQTVREVSIIPYETLQLCNTRLGSRLDFIDLRRNLVIQHFDITQLQSKPFQIGSALFRIVRTCPPCRMLSRQLGMDMMKGLYKIGGYRAEILQSGQLTVGDPLILSE